MAYQTSTNLYNDTKYIVDSAGGSPYVTIQSAINAANTAGIPATIYVRPGTYTENLTLYNNISINGDDKNAVIISGVHTPPNSGTILFANVSFTSATDVFNSTAAGTTKITCLRCLFNITNGYIYNLLNWTGDLFLGLSLEGSSTTNGIINNASGSSSVKFLYCTLGSGTAKSLALNGNVVLDGTRITSPISITGAGTISIYGGCFFEGTIAVAGTATFSMSMASICTGSTTALNLTTTTPVVLSNICINTSNATAIAGTSTVRFASVTFVNSKGLAAGIVEDLTGVTKTGEIYADTIQRMEQSGFYSWKAAGPYFDDTTLGTFQLLVGGYGYIRGKLIEWSAQNITGMTSGSTWFIYIDSTGTIGKVDAGTLTSETRSDLFVDYIVLFECLYDETTIGGVKLQHTVKENHPYSYSTNVSSYEHDVIGVVIENKNNGANITLNGTVKIAISGDDELEDHGLCTDIPDSSGVAVTWKKFYTNAAGKWAQQNSSDTFSGYYNNAGTPTVLGGSKFGVYTLYVSKDNLNSTTPTYIAVLDTSQYNTTGAASTAIANGTTAKATNELANLELAQLGYIIYSQSATAITSVIVSKSTLRATLSTAGSNTASLINTNTAAFNGILSAADTNVQAALDTIDNWGAVSTNHGVLIGQGTGVAINATAAGTANQFLISGGASADPSWSTWTMPTTPVQGDILYASSATVMAQLAKDTNATRYLSNTGTNNNPAWAQVALSTGVSGQLPVGSGGTGATTLTIHGLLVGNTTSAINAMAAGTAGQVVTSGGASADPVWTTATYPATVNKGDVLVASANNIIGIEAGATTAGYVLTANGAGTAPTFQANAGGGIGTLNGDSGSATGPTVTIAGGTNLTSSATSSTLTMNLDAAITGTTSITGANGCEIRTGTTAADTLLISAYDVDGTAYVPFITLTANNTPTMDLASATTIGSAYIYRASGTDVSVADGGTGASTLTQNGVLYGNATSAVGITAEGGTGTILVGTTSSAPSWLATGAEGKVLTSHNGTALTWETPVGGGISWSIKTSDLNPMVPDNGYIANKAGLLTFTLPTTCAVGKTLRVTGMNTAVGWRIAQSANQIIHFGTSTTTTGASGYIESINIHDSVELVCIVADLEFVVVSCTGNITIA